MGTFAFISDSLTDDNMIKGQYIHFNSDYDPKTGRGMNWSGVILGDKGSPNGIMQRYITQLNKTIRINNSDGQKLKNLTEMDEETLATLFDTMAVAANQAVEEQFGAERAALVSAQYQAQRNVKGILEKEGKALDNYLLAIQKALNVIANIDSNLWANFIISYKDFLKDGITDTKQYEQEIISAESDKQIQGILQRVFSMLRNMEQYTKSKSIQTATTNITKGAIGEYATGILNSLKIDAVNLCNTNLENVKGNSVKVLRQGKQKTVGAKQVAGGAGKVDLLSQGNKIQITIASQQTGDQTYTITGQLNSSVKWYDELKRTPYKTARNIHIQSSSSFMKYAKQIYNTDLELYGIYNSLVFEHKDSAGQAHKNVKIVKRNIVNNFLEQMLAGSGGKDLAAFMVINGRKIPILAILQAYIDDMRKKDSNDKSFVYVHAAHFNNTWEGSSNSITEAWKRSNELHRIVDDLGMTVSLDRKVIYQLGCKYGINLT